jgi:hypothetical protein
MGMAKRRSKARGKASKSRRKAKKPMTAAAAKSATHRMTRMAKPGKKATGRTGKSAAKRRHATATMIARKGTIVIPVKTGAARTGIARKTDPANPLGIKLPAMPFDYSHDSVMNVLVGMLILFAVVSAGIFYPQTTTSERALTAAAPGMTLTK